MSVYVKTRGKQERGMLWALLANAISIAVLGGVYYLAKEAGPALGGAWLLGFFSCYVIFKCWRVDKADQPVIRGR